MSGAKKPKAISVGYAGVNFNPFHAFDERQAHERREMLASQVNRMNCTMAPGLNLFSSAGEAEAAASALASADFVVLDACTFPEGKAWMRFVELVEAPIAVWSRAETEKSGPIGHNSFCGANFIVSNMARAGRRTRAFYGDADGEEFVSRLSAALKLLSAAKAAKGARIGLMGGGIVPKFHDLDVSEAERKRISSRWGIDFESVRLEDIWDIADKLPKSAIDAETARETKLYRRIDVPAEALCQQAATLLAVKDYAMKAKLAAVAIRCWPEFGAKRSLWPCGLIGHLNDMGLPAACEGDPVGALDLLLSSKLSSTPASILDITDFDDAAGTLTLWHCGQGSLSCADQAGAGLTFHSVDGKGGDGKPAKGHPAVHDMAYKPGTLTVFRTLGAFDDEFILDGELLQSDRHNTGSSGRLGALSSYGRSVGTREVRESIFSRGIPHHYAAFYKQ